MHDITVHTLNSVYVIIDVFMVCTPVRLAHVIYAMMYICLYWVFSVCYGLTGSHKPVYPPIDWRLNPGKAVGITLCLFFVALPAMQLVLFALHRLRVFLHWKCCQPSIDDAEAGDHVTATESTRLLGQRRSRRVAFL